MTFILHTVLLALDVYLMTHFHARKEESALAATVVTISAIISLGIVLFTYIF